MRYQFRGSSKTTIAIPFQAYSGLREQEEDTFHQNDVDDDNGERGDYDAVSRCAAHTFSSLISGVAEVRRDQTDDGSENGRLESGGNKGASTHIVESP